MTTTSPGKTTLADLLGRYAPCVILIDELVAYVRQARRCRVAPSIPISPKP
jgi:hypothetical protein